MGKHEHGATRARHLREGPLRNGAGERVRVRACLLRVFVCLYLISSSVASVCPLGMLSTPSIENTSLPFRP